MPLEQVDVMGIKVANVTYRLLHSFILNRVRAKDKTSILNVNVNAMNIAAKDRDFREILLSSPLVFADGIGIVLASRLLGTRLAARITYADWMWEFARFSAKHGISWYLLGSDPGTAERASRALVGACHGLQIAGCHHGYFEKSGAPNDAVIADINRSRPDVLLICFGMPEQEKWLFKNRPQIDATVFLTGGACLEYISGRVRRCPRWMGDFGLEWLYRLIQEPKRLWRRYVLGNPLFFLRLLKYRLVNNAG